jgi:hypothetical protein
MRGKRFAEKAPTVAHPYFRPRVCSVGVPFADKQRRTIHRVHEGPSGRSGWPAEDRHDCRARQKRSAWTTDRYLWA